MTTEYGDSPEIPQPNILFRQVESATVAAELTEFMRQPSIVNNKIVTQFLVQSVHFLATSFPITAYFLRSETNIVETCDTFSLFSIDENPHKPAS